MIAGAVVRIDDFQFKSGDTRDKLVVLLSEPYYCASPSLRYYVGALLTSKPAYKGINFGCQSSDAIPNYFLPEGSCYLKRTSWLLFNEFFPIDRKWMADRVSQAVARQDGTIQPTSMIPILECAVECPDLRTKHREALVRQLASYR